MRAPLALLLFLPLAGMQSPAPDPAPLAVLRGEGVQVYRCTAGGWVLDHPEARLLDESGKQVGTHGAGPSWQYQDGSTLQGVAVEKTPSPDTASIPWLVVHVTEHRGAGFFTPVQTVRRTATHGGAAPAAGCDSSHLSAWTRVPYSATYSFFAK
jgi:hypothetical protein